jgi:hypothetical protein
VRVKATMVPDTDLLEFVCAENERDRPRLVGTLTEVRTAFTPVTVAPAVLARYVGTYDFRFPENPTIPSLMSVTLADGTLRLGGAPLVAISDTKFLWGSNPLEFVSDQQGRVTHFVTIFVEGDLVARKMPDGR